jgi:hypothetical protein
MLKALVPSRWESTTALKVLKEEPLLHFILNFISECERRNLNKQRGRIEIFIEIQGREETSKSYGRQVGCHGVPNPRTIAGFYRPAWIGIRSVVLSGSIYRGERTSYA